MTVIIPETPCLSSKISFKSRFRYLGRSQDPGQFSKGNSKDPWCFLPGRTAKTLWEIFSHNHFQIWQIRLIRSTRTTGNCISWLQFSLAVCSYLLFRDYFQVWKVRLYAMIPCKKHLLCPLCAMRCGAKMLSIDKQAFASESPLTNVLFSLFSIFHLFSRSVLYYYDSKAVRSVHPTIGDVCLS